MMAIALDDNQLGQNIQAIHERMESILAASSLAAVLNPARLFGRGKMLRARLGLRVGPVAGTPSETLLAAATAIELIHSASLLHDDVIDGGYVRRNAPAFWVERGVPGAILLGDLVFFKAMNLIAHLDGRYLSQALIRFTQEVCEAETEQELVRRGRPLAWDESVDIARRKTGPLFAFMGHAAAGDNPTLRAALTESGYLIGTAYQIADDLLDADDRAAHAGKTLGTDRARDKTTTLTALRPDRPDPADFVESLCDQSSRLLTPWPDVRRAWDTYLECDMRPVLRMNIPPPAAVAARMEPDAV